MIYRGPNLNPKVVDRLIAGRRRDRIPYQLAAARQAAGTDANAMQISRAGVATGLVSIPNRYMHSPVEMISLDDIDRAADLLARFAEGIERRRFHAVTSTSDRLPTCPRKLPALERVTG